MRAAISVIIPTLNAEHALPGCAAALFEGVQAGLLREVIVSDGGSDDHTCAIAEELGAEVVTGAASRGGQLRRGAAAARGEWLLFVYPRTQLEAGWSDAVAGHLGSRRPACFRPGLERGGLAAWLGVGWARLRTTVFGRPRGDQALLIRASDYAAAGGYREDVPREDLALLRRLKHRPVQLAVIARRSAR